MVRVQEVPNGIVGVVLAQGFVPPGATENMADDVPVNVCLTNDEIGRSLARDGQCAGGGRLVYQ